MDDYTEEERAFVLALGREIAAERAALGMSRERLATLSGIKAKSIQRYEGGERDPQLVTVRALAAALGRDPMEMWAAAERRAAAGALPSGSADRPQVQAE